MTDEFEDDYPEAAKLIQELVDEHGEEWVLEHWYQQFTQLGVLMDIPEKEELPFFDEEKHETITEEEQIEIAEMRADYLENLRSADRK